MDGASVVSVWADCSRSRVTHSRPSGRAEAYQDTAPAINAAAAGYGEVRRLLEARREEVGIAKAAGADTTYRAWITFDGELPDFCTCKDMTLGGILNCTLSLGIASYHIDTVGVVASVLPCGTPASASIVIYEQIIYPNGYPLAKFTTGTTYHVPVPELNYGIDEGPIKVGR